MTLPILFSVFESPGHPNFADVYQRLGIVETRFASMRAALQALKQQRPDYIVAEFFYGYGNNYAGVNISNLDVMLYSLQKYAPQARVIVMVEKDQRQYVDPLNAILPLHAVLIQPVSVADLEAALKPQVQ
ncbi:MAG: hypothetical protein ACYDC8_12860 [Gammaproteobacteria bacterium]